MKVLAVRCSNTDFAYAIVDGTLRRPNLLECNLTTYPNGYEEHSLLLWFHQEITELFDTHNPDQLAVKAPETNVIRSNALDLRIRIEGIALMSAAKVGCSQACRKVKSTMAKGLGIKGKARYLATFDTSAITDFNSFSTKEQEAILVGWSCLE